MSEDLIQSDIATQSDLGAYASKSEIAELANQVARLESMITKTVSVLQKKVVPVDTEPEPQRMEIDGGPDSVPLPPSYRQAVDERLGKDFGATFDINQVFKIYVPLDKSNAPKEHLAMHRQDIRARAIGNGGLAAVIEWVMKVRNNLQKSGVKLPVM